jgi:hypothetical protein
MKKYSQAHQLSVRRRRSGPLHFYLVANFLFLGLACGCGTAKPTAAPDDPTQLLQEMSQRLAQSKVFSFKVGRKLDAALVEGRNLPEQAQIEISVSRPDKFLAKSDSQDTVRHLVFDGQNLTVYDETMKLYSTVPVAGTIDEAVAKINDKYGFTPPLAEFILGDPYGALSPRIKSLAYKGEEIVGGVECHHLSLGGEVADSELWIGVTDLLPRKLVATFKDRESGPQLQAAFSDWNLAAALDNKFFTFVAPQGSESIEMVTEAQMNETAAKLAARKK